MKEIISRILYRLFRMPPFGFAAIITICFLLVIKVPVKELFALFLNEGAAALLEYIVLGSGIIALTVFLAFRGGLEEQGGFIIKNTSSVYLLFIPLVFPGLLALGNIMNAKAPVFFTTLVLLIQLLIKGICEEVVFRGLIQARFLKHRAWHGKTVFRFIVYAAVFFGISHYANLLYADFISITRQVIYAFYMGLLFGALLIRVKNVWLIGLMHGLVNFIFSIGALESETSNEMPAVFSFVTLLIEVAKFALLFSPLAIIAFYLVKGIKLKACKPYPVHSEIS